MVLTPQALAPPISLEVSDSDGSQFVWAVVKDDDTLAFNLGFEKVCCFSQTEPEDQELSIKLIQASGRELFNADLRWVYMSVDRLIWKLRQSFRFTRSSEDKEELLISNMFETVKSKASFDLTIRTRVKEVALTSIFFSTPTKFEPPMKEKPKGCHVHVKISYPLAANSAVINLKETVSRAHDKFRKTEEEPFFVALKTFVFEQLPTEPQKIGVQFAK